MAPQLDALGTLFEALLPLHLNRSSSGYVVLRDRASREEVSLEVESGSVRRVPVRQVGKKTLLELDGSIDAKRGLFAGGLARALERHELSATGEPGFLRSLGNAR